MQKEREGGIKKEKSPYTGGKCPCRSPDIGLTRQRD